MHQNGEIRKDRRLRLQNGNRSQRTSERIFHEKVIKTLVLIQKATHFQRGLLCIPSKVFHRGKFLVQKITDRNLSDLSRAEGNLLSKTTSASPIKIHTGSTLLSFPKRKDKRFGVPAFERGSPLPFRRSIRRTSGKPRFQGRFPRKYGPKERLSRISYYL